MDAAMRMWRSPGVSSLNAGRVVIDDIVPPGIADTVKREGPTIRTAICVGSVGWRGLLILGPRKLPSSETPLTNRTRE